MGNLIIKSNSQNNEIEIGSIDNDNEVAFMINCDTYWLNKTEAESIVKHLKEQFGL